MPFRFRLGFGQNKREWQREDVELHCFETGQRLPRGARPALSFPHHHIICDQIGNGSEGIVQAWKTKDTGFVMAVKTIRPKGGLPPEVEILKSLPAHPNIISCFAFISKRPPLTGDCIFFENCPRGDLFDFQSDMFEKNRSIFPESFMWTIFSQLASAIAFLHDGISCADGQRADGWRPVVHRDIKPENVFIATLGQKGDYSDAVFKLGDFGLAAFYDSANAAIPQPWGTKILWPPEQTWESPEARPAGDVWGVGTVIHELAHGFPPVVAPDVFRKQQTQDNPPTLPDFWSQAVRNSWWACKTPRQPLPINLDPHEQKPDSRRLRPTPRYSDALNKYLMSALEMDVDKRATAAGLRSQVNEERNHLLALLCTNSR